jgi:predicted RNA-binding Zn-ribbon protein involved in translation (DUF1610 family)
VTRVSEQHKCPQCGADLRFDPANPTGLGKLRREIPAEVCPKCQELFGRQDDGTIVKLAPVDTP